MTRAILIEQPRFAAALSASVSHKTGLSDLSYLCWVPGWKYYYVLDDRVVPPVPHQNEAQG